jgi:predicted DNA-binding protein (MmcQ/YjbR family)
VEFPPLPRPVLERARVVCLALPEAVEVQTDPGCEFRIRRRTFAYVFSVEDPSGRTHAMLACRAEPEERAALLAGGHPFFASGTAIDRIGVVLESDTDWDELGELITDSYRIVAPKKLADLV